MARPLQFAGPLSLAVVFLLSAPALGQQLRGQRPGEYVIVTASPGYLLTKNGKVQKELPTWTLLKVQSVEKDRYQVKGIQRTPVAGWVHRGLVQPTRFAPEDSEDIQVARDVTAALARSIELAEAGRIAASLQTSQAAVTGLRQYLGRENEFYPWILTQHAYIQALSGNSAGAQATLAEAIELLPKVDLGIGRAADVANATALVFALNNDHRKATGLYIEAREVVANYLGRNHADYAAISLNLAFSYANDNRMADVIGPATDAYRTLTRILPPGAKAQLDAAQTLAYALARTGQQNQAAIYFREAIAGYRKIYGNADSRVTELTTALASLSPSSKMPTADKSVAARGQQATGFMLETLQQASLMDGDKVIASVPRGTKLWSLKQNGKWHRVRVPNQPGFGWIKESSTKALVADMVTQELIQRAASVAGSPSAQRQIMETATAALARGQRAEQAQMNGEFDAAIEAWEQTIASFDKVFGGVNFVSASARADLIGLYLHQEQFLKARSALEQAIPIQRQSLGSEHPMLADSHMGLASVLTRLRDNHSAAAHFVEAIRIYDWSLGASDETTIAARAQLAEGLRQLGQTKSARRLFAKVIENTDTPVLEGFARVSLSQIKLNQARTLPRLMLDAQKEVTRARALFKDSPDSVRGQAELFTSIVELAIGNPQAAQAHGEKALTLLKRGGADREMLAQCNALIADAMRLEGDTRAAVTRSREAVELSSDVLGQNHQVTSELRHLFAESLASNGQLEKAAVDFDQARRDAHAYATRVLTEMTPQEQIAFLDYVDTVNLHISLSLGIRHPEHAEAAATWLLNGKGLAHEIASRRSRASRLIKSADARNVFAQWSDVRRRLAVLPTTEGDSPTDRFRRSEHARLEAKQQRLFNRLPGAVQRDIHDQEAKWVTCNQVRARIPNDETLVEFIRIAPKHFDPEKARRQVKDARDKTLHESQRYFAWIIPPEGHGNVEVVDLGLADGIDREVRKARKAILAPFIKPSRNEPKPIDVMGEPAAVKQTRTELSELSRRVWSPLAEKLKGRENVCLSPDGNLWLIPWGALPLGEDQWLIEQHGLRLTVSGRYLKDGGEIAPTGNPPTIIANPDFDAKASATQKIARELVGPLVNELARVLPDMPAIRKARATELAGTAQEAVNVREPLRKYSGQVPAILVQEAASELMFKAQSRPDALFIGTHGFFDAADSQPEVEGTRSSSIGTSNIAANPLLRCGLQLAGCNNVSESGLNDGVLTGEEIVNTDLRGTRLVVLSACETGVGLVQSGQGVAGLRQAFELAGAMSVVSTLWVIDDIETAKLMPLFFKNLAAGSDNVEALRKAQLTRINARREREGAAHPLYWAAFTLTGNR